ncbi:siderophore ABC transporter substrate-binding protein [Limimaricola cinnabarinus]|uniref:siderophore ABC transporter substrate-binding protein n=1 Tax=Limimaricola cinnabarinus TaxID=1125964 RepID=UPI002FE1B55D
MKIIATSLVALTLPSLALAAGLTVETAAGEASLAARPDKVVAFDLAAIDAIDALGVALAGVPEVSPPAYLAGAMQGVDRVGTLFEPDYEALAVMAPDLIVAGGRSQSVVEPLSQVAPTIDMTIWGGALIEQAKARLATYGEIFERGEAAAELTGALDDKLAAVRDTVADKGDALIVMTNGGKVSAYGAESRFGWMHAALDLPEAHPALDAETHGEAVSFEFIAEVDPDWILVIDRGAAIGQDGEAAQATLDNPLVAGTKAARNDQILYLDSAPLYLAGGGIRSLMGTLDEIEAGFSG